MKQKPITLKEYNKLIERIIKEWKRVGLPTAEIMIKLLEEAGKYKIKDGKK